MENKKRPVSLIYQKQMTMKLIQINERHYKLKKGNKVVVEFIKLRNNLWSAISGNIGIVNDKKTLEDCILKYNAELIYLNNEFNNRLVTI